MIEYSSSIFAFRRSTRRFSDVLWTRNGERIEERTLLTRTRFHPRFKGITIGTLGFDGRRERRYVCGYETISTRIGNELGKLRGNGQGERGLALQLSIVHGTLHWDSI